jgi:hypothetical protein
VPFGGFPVVSEVKEHPEYAFWHVLPSPPQSDTILLIQGFPEIKEEEGRADTWDNLSSNLPNAMLRQPPPSGTNR